MGPETQNWLTSLLAFAVLTLLAVVLGLIWSDYDWTSRRRWVATGAVVMFTAAVGLSAVQLVYNIE